MLDLKKEAVREFWEEAGCGERLYLHNEQAVSFIGHAQQRYALEPYIRPFADFAAANGKRVLEIGVGLGADHEQFARSGAVLTGIDLTPRAIALTSMRFATMGLSSDLKVGDAEALPFSDNSFDIVYSWGVIHHSPNTPQCVREIRRVLAPGGVAKVMIYHKFSMVGYMLWLRYAALRGRFFTSLTEIYSGYLESPGTKAYSVGEARHLFEGFDGIRINTHLTHGDLLASAAGQRHGGLLLRLARATWPRRLIRTFLRGHGLFMTIEARKPATEV